MSVILIGTVGFGGRRDRLPAALTVVELAETFRGRLRPATLAAWRAELPETVHLVLRAASEVTHPQPKTTEVGHFRQTEAVEAAWKATARAARAAQASGLVLRTPASFSPTQGHRDALIRFAVRAATELPDAALIWEPVGLWEDEEAAELAAEAGLVLAVDPLRLEPPPGDVAFCRLSGPLGVRGRYDDLDLVEVLEKVVGRPLAFLVLDHPAAARDAVRLAAVAAEAGLVAS